MKAVIVFSDGSTWEELANDQSIIQSIILVTDDAFQSLCDGAEPKDLEGAQVIAELHLSTLA